MKDKIISLIQELGPIVPSEVTNKLESNSVIISALISELIKEGKILYSQKKIGNSPVYYLKGQEELVRNRLIPELNITEKKIVEFFGKNKLVLRDNLSPQQRYMIDSLRDFITPLTLNINGVDRVFYKHYSVPTEKILAELKKKKKTKRVKSVKSKVEQQKLFEQPREYISKAEVVETRTSYEQFDDLSDHFFTQYNLDILETETVKKNKEANFVVRTNYRIPQTYFVKYYKKKRVDENDISKAYADAHSRKMPCLIITTGATSKKAGKKTEKFGEFVNIISI